MKNAKILSVVIGVVAAAVVVKVISSKNRKLVNDDTNEVINDEVTEEESVTETETSEVSETAEEVKESVESVNDENDETEKTEEECKKSIVDQLDDYSVCYEVRESILKNIFEDKLLELSRKFNETSDIPVIIKEYIGSDCIYFDITGVSAGYPMDYFSIDKACKEAAEYMQTELQEFVEKSRDEGRHFPHYVDEIRLCHKAVSIVCRK